MIRGARPLQRISRRGLIASGMFAGMLAATGMQAQARIPAGTLRLGLSGASDADGWDPRSFRGTFMRIVGQGAVYDCLTEVAATGELVGELAESWESSADARVWTFTLRRGVTFHDGSPLRTEDVLASLDWHREGRSPAYPIVAQIETMRATGPDQVQFALVAGNADFPFLLSDPHLVIAPAERICSGIGTGLYRVGSFLPGIGARLERVAEHYKDGRAGWFQTIDVIALNDPAARAAALLNGEVDAINRVDAAFVPLVEATRDLRLTEVQGTAHLIASLPGNLGQEPDFARALQLGLDRNALVDAVLGGRGQVAGDHPLGLANPHLARLAPVENDPGMRSMLLARTGVDIDPTAGQLDLRLSAGRLTEDWAFGNAIGPAGAWAARFGEDRQVRALLAEARSTFDTARRGGIYTELQDMFATKGDVTVAAHLPWTDAHTARLHHDDALGAVLPLDSGRIAERWWFA